MSRAVVGGLALLMGLTVFCSPRGAEATGERPRGVVLLHGLARSAASMATLERALQGAGYLTLNIDYPSTAHPVETLCHDHVAPKVNAFAQETGGGLCFVTHSMGGILLRFMVKEGLIAPPYRAVMLSPPNQGSEVVDALGGLRLFQAINGPAGNQLGTAPDQLPQTLGPVPFSLGVLTGTRTINFLLSAMIPGPNDGKVSVARARVVGMADFRAIAATHPFIMKNKTAIAETLRFLETGAFAHRSAR